MWIAAAALTGNDAKGAWRIWRRDRRNHASPNSAQTESACARALGVPALSQAEGVPQERILCGNGAAETDLPAGLGRKPHKALVTAPTFAEYASALDTVGCEVKRFFLEEANDFAPTDALVDAVDESIDMVFLCQPNNPTGQLASPELVKKVAAPVRGVPHDFGRR